MDQVSASNGCKKSNSAFKKFWVILFSLLVLLIPLGFFVGIVNDREKYRNEAVRDVANSWAAEQTIQPPTLTFYDEKNKKELSWELDKYDASAVVETEVRKRGIFKVPVYTADVVMKGNFIKPDGDIGNNKWIFSFDVSDSKGFIEQPEFKIGKMTSFDSVSDKQYQYHAASGERSIPFEVRFKIRGVNKLSFVPSANINNIKIKGAWADPSFEGDFLPVKRVVSENGFEADWSVPRIATLDVQRRTYDNGSSYGYKALNNPYVTCGVSLLMPVDNYRMTMRAVKYGFLFLVLTFIAFFVFEITAKKRRPVHPLQYMLMGMALLVFFLLLLSISEFMPFVWAYLIASLMIIGMISLYTYFVLTKKENTGFSLLIAFILAVLYGFLYTLLMLQDFSLILGSVGLFVIIGIIMYVTRDVDWYPQED